MSPSSTSSGAVPVLTLFYHVAPAHSDQASICHSTCTSRPPHSGPSATSDGLMRFPAHLARSRIKLTFRAIPTSPDCLPLSPLPSKSSLSKASTSCKTGTDGVCMYLPRESRSSLCISRSRFEMKSFEIHAAWHGQASNKRCCTSCIGTMRSGMGLSDCYGLTGIKAG